MIVYFIVMISNLCSSSSSSPSRLFVVVSVVTTLAREVGVTGGVVFDALVTRRVCIRMYNYDVWNFRN